MTANFLRAVVQALFWTVLTANVALAATAAQLSLGTGADTVHVPWDLALLSFVISTFSGVAALLRRIDRQLRENPGPLPRPVLFIAMHLFGSWVAGALAFVGGQASGLDVWKELGLLIVCSYAGAAAIEFWAEKLAPGLPVEKLP